MVANATKRRSSVNRAGCGLSFHCVVVDIRTYVPSLFPFAARFATHGRKHTERRKVESRIRFKKQQQQSWREAARRYVRSNSSSGSQTHKSSKRGSTCSWSRRAAPRCCCWFVGFDVSSLSYLRTYRICSLMWTLLLFFWCEIILFSRFAVCCSFPAVSRMGVDVDRPFPTRQGRRQVGTN